MLCWNFVIDKFVSNVFFQVNFNAKFDIKNMFFNKTKLDTTKSVTDKSDITRSAITKFGIVATSYIRVHNDWPCHNQTLWLRNNQGFFQILSNNKSDFHAIVLRPCVRQKFPNFSFSRVSEMFGFQSSKIFWKYPVFSNLQKFWEKSS